MKLTFLTSLLLTVVAVAAAGDPKPPIAKNGQCKKDGSMGNCETGYCNQPENASQGTCEDPK